MKNAMKGVFLSGLIMPGLGQIALKHYKKGIILMLGASAGLVVIVIEAMKQALAIVEKMDLNGGAVDINAISDAATQASTASEGFIFKLLFYLIILCWVVGIVDAYRIGRKKDIEERLSK
jgi:TM2 domain-containing membrane protein YozV